MKNFFIIILIPFAIIACDDSVTGEFIIQNNSGKDLNIFYYSDSIVTDEYFVLNESEIVTGKNSGLGSDIKIKEMSDSVVFKTDNLCVLKYIRDSANTEKTIYREEFWLKEEVDDNIYKFTYEINKEDISQ
jgi:hypothetical protein